MADSRNNNVNWDVSNGGWDGAKLAVLMDIRDELQKLNLVFECRNFIRIPQVLDEIQHNTKKRKHKVATKPI